MQLLYRSSQLRCFVSCAVLILGTGFLEGRVDGETIVSTVTSVGSNLFQYSYTFTGFNLLANQELDIQFDPNVYSSLSAGVANGQTCSGPSTTCTVGGFKLAWLQPNNPPGSTGDYTLVSDGTTDPTLSGTFTVDASLISGSTPPCCQPFFVYQLNSSGLTLGTIGSGEVNGPEPGSGFMIATAAVLVGIGCIVRGRFRFRRQLVQTARTLDS
jgi:hypothetical protein